MIMVNEAFYDFMEHLLIQAAVFSQGGNYTSDTDLSEPFADGGINVYFSRPDGWVESTIKVYPKELTFKWKPSKARNYHSLSFAEQLKENGFTEVPL